MPPFFSLTRSLTFSIGKLVPLKEGDIAAVFIEDSGWWLGQVLSPSRRLADSMSPVGLFPSTYCTQLELDVVRVPKVNTEAGLGADAGGASTSDDSPPRTPVRSTFADHVFRLVTTFLLQIHHDELLSKITELTSVIAERDEEIVELKQRLAEQQTKQSQQTQQAQQQQSVISIHLVAVWILTIAIAFGLARLM